MFQERYLKTYIQKDLQKKMVFIGGPRQVGKTTLARSVGDKWYRGYDYLNWDYRDDRSRILDYSFPQTAPLLIFDEIHKYRIWKRYLKGIYDKEVFEKGEKARKILATGSARLDVYRRGGDSLLGRYHYYRLHPFSVRELLHQPPALSPGQPLQFPESTDDARSAAESLFAYGGFPEPLLSQNEETARRFRADRSERLIKEDIRDLEQVRDLSGLQVLQHLLPQKVGSLFSVQSLQEDLSVAHKTASLWVDIFERMYYLFRVQPFSPSLTKSSRRQGKIYLWDWAEVADPAARLENMVAGHLLKFTHLLYDALGYRAELFLYRDRDGREVDFIVAVNRAPWFAVEVKMDDTSLSPALGYVKDKLSVPYTYQVVWKKGVRKILEDGTGVMSADIFLGGLV